MKTWYVTNVNPAATGNYDVGLTQKLNVLEGNGHTIWLVTAISGQVVIISYKTA